MYLRLHRLAQGVKPVLNLAGMCPDCVERTRVRGSVAAALPTEGVLTSAQVVASCPPYLRHDYCSPAEIAIDYNFPKAESLRTVTNSMAVEDFKYER